VILDDFVVSMKVCLYGYKIKYEPGAFAIELPSSTLREEEKRKIRISAGAYQSIGHLSAALNFFKFPRLCFQYASRRLLRWILCPLMLLALLVTNLLVVVNGSFSNYYKLFLFVQCGFYLIAIVGRLLIRSGKGITLFTVPFYFVFMNYCLLRGFARFIGGNQSVLWEKSQRLAVE
jgi:hypothetical protein